MQLHSGHGYDVFLSYHWRDHASVERLASALRERGLRVFFDRWYLHPGRAWSQELEGVLSTCRAVAVCLGPGEMGPWQQREVNLALQRQVLEAGFPVIPVLLAGAEPVLGFLSQNTWVDLRGRLDELESISILAGAIAGNAPGPDARARVQQTVGAICPYRGLLPFREEDAPFFFGRDLAVERLTQALETCHFLAVVGASGCGKSSIVRAGLLPRLRRSRERVWEMVTVVPGDRPMKALAAVLLPLLEPDMTEADRLIEINKLARALDGGELKLRDVAERALAKQSGTDRLLVFVDQFEELYTLTTDESARRRFIDELLEASTRAPVSVVMTLRGDFIGHALAYRPLSDHLQGAQLNVGPMTRTELAVAITNPAEKVGLTFEAGLVERILDDAGQEPGNLPLLEFVLKQLWESRGHGTLHHSAYTEMGCLQGAVATKAEEIFGRFTAAEKETAQRIFLQLATPGEQGDYTRRRASVAETGAASTLVLERLTDARLLVASPGSSPGEGALELSHEALIRHWDRLRAWLDQDREFLLWRKRLAGFVDEWLRSNKQETALLTGAFLTEAEKWLSERRERLSKEERDYIAASVACHQREQERTKFRRHAFTAAIAAVGVVALLFALYSQFEKRRAEQEANHSLALELAARSGQIGSTRLAEALLLGVAAVDRQTTFETRDNLFRLLRSMPPGLRGFEWAHSGVLSIAFSPDGKTMATTGNDGLVILWDVERRQPIDGPLREHKGAVLSAAFSPDGKILATGGFDKSVILWDVASHKPLGAPLKGRSAVRQMVFRPDGKRLATVDVQQAAILWDVANHKLVAQSPDDGLQEVWSIAFSRAGKARAIGSRNLEVVLWDLDRRGPVGQPLMQYAGGPLLVAFSPDGNRLVTVEGRVVRLWDVASGEPLGEPLAEQTSDVSSIAFSAAGATLAMGSRDQTVTLWDVENRKALVKDMKGHTGEIGSLAFGPNGTTLASGSSDGSVILWDVASLKLPPETPLRCQGQVNSVAFSPDGNALAAADDEALSLWDLASRKQLGKPLGGDSQVSIAFSSDGKRLTAASADGRLSVWDAASRQPVDHPLKTFARGVRRVAFNGDGKTMAAASFDGSLTLWNIDGQEPLSELLRKANHYVQGVVFSPDGKILAAGAQDHTIMLWDVASRRLLGEPLMGHTSSVWSAAFSQDGKMLATGGGDGSLLLWDVAGRKRLGDAVMGRQGAVMAIAFQRDQQILATGGSDGTVILWDLASRKPLGERLRGHTAEVTSIAFSPDGKTLASGSWDKSVILRDGRADAGSMMAAACQVVNRNFTVDEWRGSMAGRPYRKVCGSQPGPTDRDRPQP